MTYMTREPTSWLQRRREGSGGVQDDGRPPSVLSLRATSQTSDRGASASAAARAGNKGPPAHDMQRSTAKATTKEQESPMVAGGGGGGGGRGDTPGFAPDNLGVAAAAGHRGRRARRGGGGGLWLWSFGCDPAQPSQRGPLPSIPSSPADGGSGLPHHHPPRPPPALQPRVRLSQQRKQARGGEGRGPSDPQRWRRGSPVCWASPDLLPSLPDP